MNVRPRPLAQRAGRNENPAYYDPESTLVMDSNVCLMHWTVIYHRMTEHPLWKCQSLKSLEQSNVSTSMVSAQSKCG